MIHFCSEALLKEVCDSDAGHNLPTVLVEITATVLDQEVIVIFLFLFFSNDISLVFMCGGALKCLVQEVTGSLRTN